MEPLLDGEHEEGRAPTPSDASHAVDPPPLSRPPPVSVGQRRSLYLSYAFASFGDRAWEFASLVFIVELFPTTLLYASIFGVVETIAGLLAGPYIGAWIDRNQRLPVLRASIIGQNAIMALACVVFFIALTASRSDLVLLYLAYAALTLCACAIKVSSSLNKVSLHKDWTPCVAADDRAILSEMNAAMRRVDLTNSIIAPLVIGILSSATSSTLAIVALGIWSTLSMLIEIQLCARVWVAIPALQIKDVADATASARQTDSSSASRSLQAYYKSRVFWASVAYCVLYISVLNFGGIMTSFLASDAVQLSDALLAVGRAAGAAIGITATVATPHLIRRYGLVHTGSIALLSQVVCLIATQAAFLLLSSLSQSSFIVILFTSLSASRFGLWSYDLVETELMQTGNAAAEAGIVNGAQESLMNVAYILSFVLTIVFSDPSTFVIPATISFASVVVAAVVYLRWTCSADAHAMTAKEMSERLMQ